MNFTSLSKAAMAAGSVLKDVQAKATDLAHDAGDLRRRATQQALEAAGMADKTDDSDSLPEMRCAGVCHMPHGVCPDADVTCA